MSYQRRINPSQMAIALKAIVWMAVILLVACACSNNLTQAPPQPSSTRSDYQAVSGGIAANGVLLPARQVRLSFGVNGFLEERMVGIGDQVSSGQVLARLNELEAGLEVAAAQASLDAAQADYNLAEKDLAAEGKAAALALMEADELADLYEGAEMARSAALSEIVAASREADAVQYRLYYFSVPASLAGLKPLEALAESRVTLAQARADFDPYKNASQNSQARQVLKEALDKAQAEFDAASRRMEMEAELVEALTRLEKAERDYHSLQNGPDPDDIALAESRVAEAQARVNHTEEGQSVSDQLVLAQAQINAAQSRLALVQAQLEMTSLFPPSMGWYLR